jgi:hypothetical protein
MVSLLKECVALRLTETISPTSDSLLLLFPI